jgi:hypothetical protein
LEEDFAGHGGGDVVELGEVGGEGVGHSLRSEDELAGLGLDGGHVAELVARDEEVEKAEGSLGGMVVELLLEVGGGGSPEAVVVFCAAVLEGASGQFDCSADLVAAVSCVSWGEGVESGGGGAEVGCACQGGIGGGCAGADLGGCGANGGGSSGVEGRREGGELRLR